MTGLGRSIPDESYEKHQIRKADCLIGNLYINHERQAIYRALAKLAIGTCLQSIIHVDWSDLTPDREFYLVRAIDPVGGRALPVYEALHRQKTMPIQKLKNDVCKS